MKSYIALKTILVYDDLINISAVSDENNKETLVNVQKYSRSIVTSYNKFDMLAYTGKTILVRDSVAKKLAAINSILAKKVAA